MYNWSSLTLSLLRTEGLLRTDGSEFTGPWCKVGVQYWLMNLEIISLIIVKTAEGLSLDDQRQYFWHHRVMNSHLFHITISRQCFISITPETKSFLTFSGGLHPANIYLSKINNRNTRKRREIYSRLSLTSFWCF